MNRYIILCIAFFIGLQSCETDFEVNAPWKNITIVYGILDQSDNPHVIKINKAFLGAADVNDMAQIADSSEYAADEITVTIERSLNGGAADETYSLTRFVSSTKPAGTFFGPDQVLYKFSDTLLSGPTSSTSTYDYKLVIKNVKTGKKVTASTKIIKHFKFKDTNYWAASAPSVGFYKNGVYNKFKRAVWKTAVNGRRYELTLRFNYKEIDLDDPLLTETWKKVDWVFPSVKSQNLFGGDELGPDIDGEDFYKFIADNLAPVSSSNNVQRCIGELDFLVSVAGEDFNTYMDVNGPSTGIVQERPEFTNVFDENGNAQVGFFSARYSIMETGARLNTAGISGNSVTELEAGQYTSGYGFIVKKDNATCPF